MRISGAVIALAAILSCGNAGSAVPPETLPAVKALMAPGAPIETAVAETNGWVEIDYLKDIEKGSALDFSGWGILDGPAGKYGRVVARNGHFEFEKKPGVPQRFYGVNICSSTCFPDAAEVDKMLTRFERLGYNTFRIHHYDRVIACPSFKPPYHPETATNALDMLDRLIAEAGKRGFYMTIDLFTVRPIRWRACGIDRDGVMDFNTYKILIGCHEGAYRDWERFARRVMAHRNPYNGLTWAEDPAVPFVDLVNEGCVPLGGNLDNFRARRFGGRPRREEEWLANPIVLSAWSKWLAAKRAENPGYAPDAKPDRLPDSSRHAAAMAFVCEMDRNLTKRQKDFLASIGFRGLVTSNNNFGRDLVGMQRTAVDLYDYRDMHFYHDHCIGVTEQNPTRPPQLYRLTDPCRNPYLMMTRTAFVRIPGMPFTITEFDFPVPSPYRAAGTIMTAALAALQDWDALWHFSYSHELPFLHDGNGVPHHYNLSTDPIGQMADRLFASVFMRRDVKPLVRAWTMDLSGATPDRHPRGEEWSATPANALPDWTWTDAAWRTRVGSSFGVPDGWNGVPREKADAPSGLLPLETLQADPQLVIHRKPADNAHFTLTTASACAGNSARNRDLVTAGALSFRIGRVPATVACVSLDGDPVPSSSRMLVLHLTDAIGEGARWVRGVDQVVDSWKLRTKMVLGWGRNNAPTLVKDGYAEIELALERPNEYEVFALATSGKRMGSVPSSVKNGKLCFTANVKGPDGKGRLAYEIARKAGW